MKNTGIFCVCFLFLFCWQQVRAQLYLKYEVKVFLKDFQPVRGTLQMVNSEGLALEDVRGNYYIFRPEQIIRIKLCRKGLHFLDALGGGTGLGLTAGISVFFAEQNHDSFKDKLTGVAVLTAAGIAGGALTGGITELFKTKLILKVSGNREKFIQLYQKLRPYAKVNRS